MSSDLLPCRLTAVAESSPKKIALIQNDTQITFEDLASAIQQFGDRIRPALCNSDRVAAVLENSPSYVIACYATWTAGGVFVGLNTAIKEPELLQLIERCDAKLSIVDAKYRVLRASLAKQQRAVIVIGAKTDDALHTNETRWELSTDSTSKAALVNPAAFGRNANAQIIFTSGTTGSPKGVVLTHGNLAANTASIQSYLRISPDDIAMCVLPFFYSYGTSVLHTHLTAGSTIVLENSFMYPQQVLVSMNKHAVTAFYGVPSTYYLLLDRTQVSSATLPRLRYCAQAGGPMEPRRIEAFCERLADSEFFVMFGQTEASSRLTYLPPADRQRKSGSVGIPIPGVTLTVRDVQGHALADGEQGEVCARGDNIMAGYWQDAEETAKAIKHGWLYTGDLGYRDSEGFFYLVGRSREMIKSGAHRIAPKEIEEVIASVPGVREVAVIGVPDDILGESIKACVVTDIEPADLAKQIQRTCREQLALYKVPKTVEFLDELPKTASGKIMKHRLISNPR